MIPIMVGGSIKHRTASVCDLTTVKLKGHWAQICGCGKKEDEEAAREKISKF
jgi:hypothetical protein